MKAIVCSKYGSPQNLQLMEVPKPEPKQDEVLVKVHAASINDFDWSLVRGKPYAYRLIFGLARPKIEIPGIELSGTVEAVGENVSAFKPGDAVYGDISEYRWGSFAEYICVKPDALAMKSPAMSFEEAAALPHASMLAMQGLIEVGKIKKGEKVLLNGAGGGVGTIAFQLAKLYDAEITGVDTGEKLNGMRTLGFHHIIDYKKEDFTQNNKKYDLILDAKTTRNPSAYQRVLTGQGRYVTVGGELSKFIKVALSGKILGRKMFVVGLKPNKELAYINELFEKKLVKPIIDGPYRLDEVPYALQYFGKGKHRGKVVIAIADAK